MFFFFRNSKDSKAKFATTASSSTSANGTAAVAAIKSGPAAYVELAYIPAHGNGNYVDVEFFKRVRAKNYVLSSAEPNEHVLNALAEAKELHWTSAEDKSALVTLIPTYETETLRKWFVQNEERLARLHIDVSPAACHATVTMDENPQSSCNVYKLEL